MGKQNYPKKRNNKLCCKVVTFDFDPNTGISNLAFLYLQNLLKYQNIYIDKWCYTIIKIFKGPLERGLTYWFILLKITLNSDKTFLTLILLEITGQIK